MQGLSVACALLVASLQLSYALLVLGSCVLVVLQPPEDEMLSVAVEGLLACFEDTLEVAKGALEKGSSVLQVTTGRRVIQSSSVSSSTYQRGPGKGQQCSAGNERATRATY